MYHLDVPNASKIMNIPIIKIKQTRNKSTYGNKFTSDQFVLSQRYYWMIATYYSHVFNIMCNFTYHVCPEKSLFLEGHDKVGHLNRFSVTSKFQNIKQLSDHTIVMPSICEDGFANMIIHDMIKLDSSDNM